MAKVVNNVVNIVLIACMVVVLLMSSFLAEGQPNGPKPKKVKCQDKNYPQCYHVKMLCPDPCPRTCRVDCVTCQPVCGAAPLPSPSTPTYTPPSQSPPILPPPQPSTPPSSPVPTPPVTPPTIPTPPSSPVPNPPVNPPTIPTPPSSSPVPTPPSSPVPTPVTPPTTPTPPSSSVPTPPSSPVPTPVTPTPPSSPVPTPTIPTPVPSPPSSNYTPPNWPPEVSGRRVYCKNKNYPKCYRMEQRCPAACPDQCEVDCVTCSPVCDCNRPGAVCQDPRFVGADGITFYFHGKKDRDFCIVSDSNLHINAHFIGRRNENMKRDFTWVQSLGILFDDNQIFIGAKKTATWNKEIDRLHLAFNGQPISLSDGEGSKWESISGPAGSTASTPLSITRSRDTNAVVIEAEGNFQIKATVVPITQKDSRIHKYGITKEDCFAHLDLSFKFYSLTGTVNGVLGQTYADNYVSRVKMGVAMPVLGGDKEFSSSDLFSTDCSVARFSGSSSSTLNNNNSSKKNFDYAKLKCVSGLSGRGVVCRR